MKTRDEVFETLGEFQKKYGIEVRNALQGSQPWFQVKLGVISASNANKVLSEKGSETRATYMAELVAQVCTGQMEEVSSKYIDWGHQFEDVARATYEFQTNFTVEQLPFVFKDKSFRAGCSPDGLVNNRKGVEIKCPYNPVHYVKFLVDEKIKPEYRQQAQFTLWVMDADEWDFVQYQPNMKKTPMKVLTIKRDPEIMKLYDEAVPEFISEMDQMLKTAGFRFGEHWEMLSKESHGS